MLDWVKIKTEFETTAITLKELAEKYNVSAGTVRSRKNREKWVKQNDTTQHATRNTVKATQRKQRATRQRKQRGGVKNPGIKIEDVSEGLTEKQRLFCWYFIHNRNATQAAIRAGYSQGTAYSIGYELLRKPEIRAEIERLKKIRDEAIMLTQEDIIERYMCIAFADITDIAEWEVKEKELDLIDPDTCTQIVNGVRAKPYRYNTNVVVKASNQIDGGLIKEISQTEHGIKIKLEDRLKALEWLANYMSVNPMNKHKIAFDNAVLALREKELQAKVW